jgi:hypothetical protein
LQSIVSEIEQALSVDELLRKSKEPLHSVNFCKLKLTTTAEDGQILKELEN